jgi:hypothetical protein
MTMANDAAPQVMAPGSHWRSLGRADTAASGGKNAGWRANSLVMAIARVVQMVWPRRARRG